MSKTSTKPAKKKPDNEILHVGDRLRVVHPYFGGEVTCEVLDVIDPSNNLRVPGRKGRVVAWAEVTNDPRPAWRRHRTPIDRVAVIEGRWRRIRCAETTKPKTVSVPEAAKVPCMTIDFAPTRPHYLGLPSALIDKIVREFESDNETAVAPLLVMSGPVAAIGAARGATSGCIEHNVVTSFVSRLFRVSDGGLEELFSHVFDVMSVLTQYADPATGVKKVLADLSPRLVIDSTPEGFRAATWIERRLPALWTTPVICRFWLTCSDDTRRHAIAQYRGEAEALKMVPMSTPPDAAGAYEGE